jgi:hypothetical protein
MASFIVTLLLGTFIFAYNSNPSLKKYFKIPHLTIIRYLLFLVTAFLAFASQVYFAIDIFYINSQHVGVLIIPRSIYSFCDGVHHSKNT